MRSMPQDILQRSINGWISGHKAAEALVQHKAQAHFKLTDIAMLSQYV